MAEAGNFRFSEEQRKTRSQWKKPRLLEKFSKNKAKRTHTRCLRKPTPFSVSVQPRSDSVQAGVVAHHAYAEVSDEDDDRGIDAGAEPDIDSDTEPESVSKSRKRSYAEQKKKQTKAWDAVTLLLEDKFLPPNVFDANTICSLCTEPALFRCVDCGPWMSYCKHCCITQHSQCCFLHVPEKWENGRFVPVMLMNIEMSLDHCCLTEFKDKITIVSLNGYHYGVVISFCRCKSKVERLVDLHLWPATPQSPRVAFTMRLLDVVHAAMLECHVSIHHACGMLQSLSRLKISALRKTTYQQLLVSFPRYRCFKNQRRNGTASPVCPACPKDADGTAFISLDGNFRLCRRKNAGQQSTYEKPLSGDRIFVNQLDVDCFVQSSSSVTSDRDLDRLQCHEFKAGDALRSKSRFHALDETGVFGVTCKHDIPLKMLSMKQGEKLAYADFILTTLLEENKVPSRVYLLYDIGCKLIAHWKRHSERLESLPDVFNVAIPIFHAYAHNVHCQFTYSPRYRVGFGLTDGENLERLWSYLGRFAKMTKEMNAAHRIDTLTDALCYYSEQKCGKMESSIVHRIKKTFRTKASSEEKLRRICATLSITGDELAEILPQMREEELKRLDSISRAPVLNQSPHDWRLTYVRLLQSWLALQSKWMELVRSGIILTPKMITETVSKLQMSEHELKEMESNNHVESRWQEASPEFLDVLESLNTSDRQRIKGKLLGVVKERVFYLNTLAYHAGGQKQAQRVSKLIALCAKKAKELLSEYKLHCSSPDQTTIQDVFNTNSPFWTSDHTYAFQAIDRIPVTEQRRLIELTHIHDRCLEELQYCVSDILNMYEYFTSILIQLNLNMCRELSMCSQNLPESLDPSENQLYMVVGDMITSGSIPKQTTEVISAIVVKAECTYYRLQRISDVATNLVMAYWAEVNSNQQKYVKKALDCSNKPICVPRIYVLNVHPEVVMNSVLSTFDDNEQENQIDTEDISNNESTSSRFSSESDSTDIEIDISS